MKANVIRLMLVVLCGTTTFTSYAYGRNEYDWESLTLKGKVAKVTVQDFGVQEAFGEYVKGDSPRKSVIYYFNANGSINTVLLKEEELEVEKRAEFDRFVYEGGKLSAIYQLKGRYENKKWSKKVNLDVPAPYIVVDTIGRTEYSYDGDRIIEINVYAKGGYYNKGTRLEKKTKYQYTPTGYIKRTYKGDGALDDTETVDGKTKTVEYRQSSIVYQLNDNMQPIRCTHNLVGSNGSVRADIEYDYNEHGDLVFQGIKSKTSDGENKSAQGRVFGRDANVQNSWKYIYDSNGNWTDQQHFRGDKMEAWTTRTIVYASSDADIENQLNNFTFSDSNISVINEKFQHAEDSLAKEKAEIEYYTNFINEMDKEYIGVDGYHQNYVKKEDGSIKKCTSNNGELCFVLKNGTLSGTFSKIKHGYKSFDAYKDMDGKLIIYRKGIDHFGWQKKNIAILISRNGDENTVYNLKGDALEVVFSELGDSQE